MKDRAENDYVSLIVPVYNSAATVDALWSRVAAAMDAAGRTFELIFIDDASSDGTAERLRALARRDRRIRLLIHRRNAGAAAAVRTGIAHARGAILVTLDDDLQHRPEDIPRLLRRLAEADDPGTLVIAVAATQRRGWMRDAAGVAVNILSNVFLPRPLPLHATNFCAFRRILGQALLQGDAAGGGAWLVPLVQAAGRTLTLPVAVDASHVGRSRYTIGALWSVLRGRALSFKPRRVLAVAFAAAIVTAVVTALAIRQGSVALAILAGLAAMIAAILSACMMAAGRRGKAPFADQPVIIFVPEDETAPT